MSSTEEIRSFLAEARRQTWAGKKNKARSKVPGSKRYVFESGRLRYEDEYFGEETIMGREVVLLDNHPYWSMIYSGRTENYDPELSEFLRQILLNQADVVRMGASNALIFRETPDSIYFSAPEPKSLAKKQSFERFDCYEIVSVGSARLIVTLIGGALR